MTFVYKASMHLTNGAFAFSMAPILIMMSGQFEQLSNQMRINELRSMTSNAFSLPSCTFGNHFIGILCNFKIRTQQAATSYSIDIFVEMIKGDVLGN